MLFVVLLAAIGSGPATYLPERFDRAARWALAPVFGLCVGVCVTVTLVYAFPTRDTSWVLIVLAVASVALACWHTGRPAAWRRSGGASPAETERPFAIRRSPGIVRDAFQIGVVVIVILVSFNYPLGLRHTVGPDGGYAIADTTGYVSETNGEERDSIHQAEHLRRAVSRPGDVLLGGLRRTTTSSSTCRRSNRMSMCCSGSERQTRIARS